MWPLIFSARFAIFPTSIIFSKASGEAENMATMIRPKPTRRASAGIAGNPQGPRREPAGIAQGKRRGETGEI